MSDAAGSPVTTERRGAVLVVHLDDGRVNAVSHALADGITAAIRDAEADDQIGAVVIHGRPGKFSAGFDLSVVRDGTPAESRELVADGGRLVHTMYSSKVPIVAACTGHAIAMGALLLMGCDVRVGPDVGLDQARIGMSEVAIGMSLPEWAITILAERLDRKHLQTAAATAQMYGPHGAVEVGFLDELESPEQVLDRAVEIADGFADGLHPGAYVLTIRRLRGEMLARLAAQVDDFRATGSLT